MRLFFRLAGVMLLCSACALCAQVEHPKLALNESQRAWLRAHPVIRLGFDPDFRPFCFRDAAGQLAGIDAEVLQLIEQRTGVRFETRTAGSWREVYQAAMRRELDVLSSTADAPERREAFRFTREYIQFPVTIVTRVDGPFALTHSDLKSLRVAAARDYAATLAFRRNFPGVSLLETDTIEEALLMVAAERADATVTNLTNASYVIKTRGLANLKIAGVVPEMFEMRFAVRSDWPELQEILDQAVASITPQEMATILDHWVKVDYARVIRWDVVRRWSIIGAIFALTVIGLITWRNAGLARELAKRRVVQAELERTNQQLEHANSELVCRHDEKSELMRVAAHDLRGPLTAITLSAEMLPFDASADSGRVIKNAARQMTHLIDDLLEVHALEEGRKAFRHEVVEVVPLLQAAAEGHRLAAQAKRIALDLSALAPVPSVQGDPGALRQVFDNLLSNAIKFSPFDRTVALRTSRWNEHVRIEVRDQGPGVPDAERERIFSKYARGTAKPTAGERSTGLGLAIVRDIVAIMNGRTWCENAETGGAIFVVALPLVSAPPAAVAHPSRVPEKRPIPPASTVGAGQALGPGAAPLRARFDEPRG